MPKRASIVDVASKAGVSVSTVSLVMNNRPNVAPSTAEVVWQAAKSLGYRPGGDGKKRGPKPGPRRSITAKQFALLFLEDSVGTLRCSMHIALIAGIERALRERNIDMLLRHSHDEDDAYAFVRGSRVQGIIVIGEPTTDRLCAQLRRTPSVQVLGKAPATDSWDHVTSDNRRVGSLAACYLLEEALAQCAYIGTGRDQFSEWQCEFQRLLSSHGTEVHEFTDPDLSCHGRTPSVCGQAMGAIARSVTSALPGPAGLFVECSVMLSPLLTALADCGARRDAYRTISCHQPFFCGAQDTGPSPLISLHLDQVGAQAVDQVIWRLDHRNEPRVRRLVNPSIQTNVPRRGARR